MLALGVLVHTLAGADLAKVAALVARAGGWVAIGLIPYMLVVLADVTAWRVLVRAVGAPPLWALVRIRLRSDAFGATLPGGTIVAESMTPVWLRRWMPVDAGVAAVAGRKCFVGFAEALYILASFAAGFSILGARAPALPWVVLGLGLGDARPLQRDLAGAGLRLGRRAHLRLPFVPPDSPPSRMDGWSLARFPFD